MRRLVIATRNKGKIPEIARMLEGLPFSCVSLDEVSEIPSDFEVEETAPTFEGNAILKATETGKRSGELSIADDSGLEVDALGGRPGVLSARYASGSDADRYRKLLEELKGVPEERRGAQFRSVIAVYDPRTHVTRTCEGIIRGKILFEPKGEGGFGYDPVFFVPGLGKTFSEMPLEEKNSVSHRGQALRKMREILEAEFSA